MLEEDASAQQRFDASAPKQLLVYSSSTSLTSAPNFILSNNDFATITTTVARQDRVSRYCLFELNIHS